MKSGISFGCFAALFAAALSFAPAGAFAASGHDTPPPGFKLTAWQRSRMPPTLEVRREMVKSVKEGELRLRPTFNGCGVAWGSGRERPGVAFEYRKAGDPAWKTAPTPLWFKDTGDVRGSILYLEEDTGYEMRVVLGGETLASGGFRTWSSDVPVAKTVVIDPATAEYPIRISGKGSPDGWIRYTVPPGKRLGGRNMMERIVEIDGAEHVLVENIVFEGGGGEKDEPLFIMNSRAVRIRNCEFHGWGRTGPQNFETFPKTCGGGKFLDEKRSTADRPVLINYDAAMRVDRGASEIVIERCYVHDPRGHANSWLYSHPAGPSSVLMAYPDHSCVIRYCDFTGSDNHRYNDAVEGAGNFIADGGFNQDADVYGNFMIYCSDDNIELDGGQQNVRCFWNRFESSFSGVSIQGCCVSPVYVMDNLFSGMGDEFGFMNASIKTATFDPWWYAPYAAIWRNVYQDSGEFCIRQGATSRWDIRDNRRMKEPPQETLARFPVRPVGFMLDTGRIDGVAVKGDVAEPSRRTVTARSGSSSPIPFRVRKSFDADWFDIRPSEGVIPPGGEVRFEVSFDAAKMRGRRHWRSAFIVRTPEGLSRCVSVKCERTDHEIPARPVPPSDGTMYAAPETNGDATMFRFDVKKPGRYWFFVRAQAVNGAFPKPEVSIDGGDYKPSLLCLWSAYPAWSLIRPGQGSRWDGITRHFDLEPGRHTLEVRQAGKIRFNVTGAALTTVPTAFSPK